MGARRDYAAGAFSWVELATTDIGAARSFYTGLFGWEIEDVPSPPGVGRAVCRLDGDAVCGLHAVPPATGDPAPEWVSHVTVADADATAHRARSLGGAVVAAPSDVMDLGRMAMLCDPQGAVFAVWRPGARAGAERVNDVGCLCMNELLTPDLDGARRFYGALFGWTTEVAGEGPDGPAMVFARNRGTLNASMFPGTDGGPPRWRPAFTVTSADAAADRARALGGTVEVEPVDLDGGSIAVICDPLGAPFSVFAGETDP